MKVGASLFVSSRGKRGFTIVELLIVIVVIAILAAITMVAYNGVTQQARTSTVQSAASQARQKIATFSVSNAEQYPETLTALGLSSSSDISYTYEANNYVSPKTFCFSATSGTVSYRVTQATLSPEEGYCAVTNLAPNPSLETNATDYSVESGDGGVATAARQTSGGYSGSAYYRATWTTGSTGNSRVTYAISGVTPGSYCISLWVRSSVGGSLGIGVLALNGSSFLSYHGSTTNTTVTANTWARLYNCFTASNSATNRFGLRIDSPSFGNAATGLVMDVDAVMLTRGDTLYTYADGASAGWSWADTSHASTSSGPAL